jgi:hypothetical protein
MTMAMDAEILDDSNAYLHTTHWQQSAITLGTSQRIPFSCNMNQVRLQHLDLKQGTMPKKCRIN